MSSGAPFELDEEKDHDNFVQKKKEIKAAFDLFDREKKTFCSKHCAEVLQTAGLKAVADLKPAATTPSALFRALGGVAVFHADLDVMASLRIR